MKVRCNTCCHYFGPMCIKCALKVQRIKMCEEYTLRFLQAIIFIYVLVHEGAILNLLSLFSWPRSTLPSHVCSLSSLELASVLCGDQNTSCEKIPYQKTQMSIH